jgi:hypothetical protein
MAVSAFPDPHSTGSFASDLERLVRVAMGQFPPRAGVAPGVLDAAARRLGTPLPVPLQDFYRVVGGLDEVMISYQRFTPPGALALENRGLVFCEENQVVVFWGVLEKNLRREDPPVHQGNPGEKAWHEDCASLRAFLHNMTCWQLLCSQSAMGVCEASPTVEKGLARRLVPVTAESDYEVQSFVDEPHGILACRIGSAGEFHVGARSDDDLRRFDRDTGAGISWG